MQGLNESFQQLTKKYDDLTDDLLVLKSEIPEQAVEKQKVKEELSKKEKEADKNREALEKLKEKQALFSSALDFQRELFVEDIQQAENRQEELHHMLQGLNKSFQQLTSKYDDLTEEKEQLEEEITKKQKLREKLFSQKALVEDTEVFSEMIADYQASIDKSRKRFVVVDREIEKQRAKEKQLKQEVAKTEKEVDDNKRILQKLNEKHSVICSTLEAKRKIFDCQLRQNHQSSEKLQEEQKVNC